MRHADELLKLARGLRSIPVNKFDIQFWGREPSGHNYNTVACAASWLPKLVPECGIKHLGKTDRIERFNFIPTYKGLRGFLALSRYFQIPHDLVERVFSDDGYKSEEPTPEEVADEIVHMVNMVRNIERQARKDMRAELRKKRTKTAKRRK